MYGPISVTLVTFTCFADPVKNEVHIFMEYLGEHNLLQFIKKEGGIEEMNVRLLLLSPH